MNGAAETDGQGATTAKIDLGASILSGSNGNPLCVLAKQLKLKSHARSFRVSAVPTRRFARRRRSG